MRQAVLDNFIAFSTQFEGRVAVMYLDTHNPPLVTTGIGNLIDPLSEALKLPWRLRKSGALAIPSEISKEWTRVKVATLHAHDKVVYWTRTANLYLTNANIDVLVLNKVLEFERILARRFPNWSSWPAPAQLATLSMAWAMGPSFRYPIWELDALAGNWSGCAEECWIPDDKNPGLTPRNLANKKLFLWAATAVDPEVLFLDLKGKN